MERYDVLAMMTALKLAGMRGVSGILCFGP